MSKPKSKKVRLTPDQLKLLTANSQYRKYLRRVVKEHLEKQKFIGAGTK